MRCADLTMLAAEHLQAASHTGIIHKYIKPIMRSFDMLESRFDGLVTGEVDLNSLDGIACLDFTLQLVDGEPGFGERPTAHEDVVGCFGGTEEGFHDFEADAVVAACHHDDFLCCR